MENKETKMGEKFMRVETKERYITRKDYWDYYSTMTTSYNKGIAKGIAEGKDEANRENARRMKADGMTFELISKYTSLTKEEIEDL